MRQGGGGVALRDENRVFWREVGSAARCVRQARSVQINATSQLNETPLLSFSIVVTMVRTRPGSGGERRYSLNSAA